MTPAIGDVVAYRALAGEVYPARVMLVRPGGLLDIEVDLPGVRRPFGRTRVKWSDARTAERGVAMPGPA